MIAVLMERYRHSAIFESYFNLSDAGIFYPLKVNEWVPRDTQLFDVICMRTKGTPVLRMRRDLMLQADIHHIPEHPYALVAPTYEYFTEFLSILDPTSRDRFAYVPWDRKPRASLKYAGVLRMSNCSNDPQTRETMRSLENQIDHSMRQTSNKFVTDDYSEALAHVDSIEAEEAKILKLTRYESFITRRT